MCIGQGDRTQKTEAKSYLDKGTEIQEQENETTKMERRRRNNKGNEIVELDRRGIGLGSKGERTMTIMEKWTYRNNNRANDLQSRDAGGMSGWY